MPSYRVSAPAGPIRTGGSLTVRSVPGVVPVSIDDDEPTVDAQLSAAVASGAIRVLSPTPGAVVDVEVAATGYRTETRTARWPLGAMPR